MAETSIAVTPGTGATVDGFNSGATSTFRQAVVLADPTTTANVMTVNSNGSIPVQGYQLAPITFSGVTTVSTLASTTATGFNIATVTLRTFTGTSPSITFSLQASDDNTNWVTIQGINNSTGIVSTTWTQAAALTAGTAGPSIDYTIGAYTNVRISITAISGTTPSAAFGLSFQTMPYEASPGIASLPALPTGTNSIGTVQIGNTANTTPILVENRTHTAGGATTFTLISAATTNATSIKASAGTVYGIQASNTGAAVAFLKIFNLAAAPTVGTSVAAKTLIIPAGGGITVPIGPAGLAFGTGISISITGLATTADTTAVALAQVVANIDYA